MPDLYATIAETSTETQEMIGDALTVRAEEAQMIEMRRRYFGWLDLPADGRGLEIGSGTGHVAADLLETTPLGEVVGLDPSPVLLNRARAQFGGREGLDFVAGDARACDLPDRSFDAVIFHTTLCHIPEPEAALSEAFRLLRPSGTLAVFDGDYATITAARSATDPVQTCLDHAATQLIHDPWLCRTLPDRLRGAGFEILRQDAHPYLATGAAAYFLTLVSRGAAFMAADGLVSKATADALEAEARARVAAGAFFGFISFLSVIARRPV
ncbi:methyltransferase domain-containing protein [Jannaschia seohaensis]|uniref:Methyltransferase domain-containing protein n=1 Tax=Jannaschia seohaensis TaxID=475081 RepID=A0A2Y9ARI2_9RHOB|nr:methyltransferase domain-containing protein [Jannaschia seohaensis]PWJ18171.1 methyltransferase family protein [Jannaschia seohaensis]SSA46696.1 Methyltransferase domain-containing protein [Jannaschia seohaensis]